MKRGFTLVETVVVIGIASTLSTGIGIGYGKFHEKLDLEEAKITIISTLENYRDRAYYNYRSYTLLIDTNNKYIEIWEDNISAKRERIYLPKSLRYQVPTLGSQGNALTKINPNGNLSDSFTVYIFGKSEVAKYRLGFYHFLQLKYFKINLYKNIAAEGAVFGNIKKYHETSDAKNLKGWEMVK